MRSHGDAACNHAETVETLPTEMVSKDVEHCGMLYHQVAVKVGCPKDDGMLACLKTKKAKTLAMAAPFIGPSSPDREHMSTYNK